MKYLIVVFFCIVSLYGKKDFYYSFIDENKNQIDQNTKDKIIQSNGQLNQVRTLLKNNKIEDAYEKIMKFRLSNKIEVLNSSSTLLYAEILYKLNKKKYAVEGAKVLEEALNKSIIIEADLLDGLKLLIKLFIKINKIKQAKFYANTILETFDDPLSQAYGKMALASISTHKRRYKTSIKELYDILVKTDNMEVATVVADELYDVYVLNNQDEKAYELASKVLEKNIDYYANDSYLAMVKINKLIEADMPKLAIEILHALLDKAKDKDNRNKFKFILANTYMMVNSKDLEHAFEAKELYKDLISSRDVNPYKIDSKMYVDEILMRERKLTPTIIIKKYKHNEDMQNKAMLQEMLNYAKDHDYVSINKFKRIYKKIPKKILNRFGYESFKELMGEINSNMISYYLSQEKCKELSVEIAKIDQFSLKKLMLENKDADSLLNCMLNNPNQDSFDTAYSAYKDSKDGNIYLKLQSIAMQLHDYKKAFEISKQIDMIEDEKIQSKEFLNRFIIFGKQNSSFALEKFFQYALDNPNFIEENVDNPLIIDFYNQYYLYLIEKNKIRDAKSILVKLYNKQKEMDAFVYSPYVELQLANEAILDDDYDKAETYYYDALEHPRKINDNNLAKIYYEMSKLYKKIGKENRYLDAIDKCKKVKNATNMYKELCDKL
ncbi:MAG TPA: hypothetical protein ENK66_02245 [Arcobacter sp.]|nr:hypothetical protein [Arcobacter sp.]